MTVWVAIILALGIFLMAASEFIIENNMVSQCGLVIAFIALGILVRMFKLSRRGERERMARKLKDLESPKPPASEEKSPASPPTS